MEKIEYPTTTQAMYQHLQQRLAEVVPDVELQLKAELAIAVNRLKQEKRAVILGHNYMEPALFHSVPDYTGDSLYLSRVAAKADCDIIVFCGVRFMAETAKILNPHRTVLLPSPKGGCSLAESITATDVVRLKETFPGVPVVSYVNTYADVKAVSDYCCTSSNGEAVVRHLQEKGHEQVIFLPDEYLASNVARQTGLDIIFPVTPGEEPRRDDPANLRRVMVGWRGKCEVHERFTVEDVEAARKQFPGVVVLAHPECSPEVVAASDYAGSTTGMIRYVENMESGQYLLLTECSMGDNIASQNPQREMIRMCSIRCPHMNEITLEETVASLQQGRYAIEVPEETGQQARRALDRMIAIG
jgi:quinolinate synthase